MKCPVCKDPTLVISERKGIEIDYCPECRGIWLDRGELDKILAKSQEEEPAVKPQPVAQPSAPVQNPYPQQGYYQKNPYKRRKSFFEELFD